MKSSDLKAVALGANLPGAHADLRSALEAALDALTREGLTVVRRSSWWRSQAWPDPSAPAYLNGIALVEADADPEQAMTILRRIESRFGRVRGEPNAPRTLDLDLIAWGRETRDGPELILPHPRAHQRRFVMGPLAEVAPDWRHPVSGLSAAELAEAATVGRDATPV